MNRSEKLLDGIDLQSAKGVEIGGLDKPIIPPDTPDVFYVDHLNTEGLRQKYRDDPNVNVDALVHVSGVIGEHSIADVAKSHSPFDFIVASHVIEHVPDLIQWLNELGCILKTGGTIRLAIPDRRFTFDMYRRETELHDVIASHVMRAKAPLAHQLAEYRINERPPTDPLLTWTGQFDPKDSPPPYSAQDAIELASDAFDNGAYHDIHCWVFTPYSFARLMLALAQADLVNLKCDRFFATEYGDMEFFVTLQTGVGSKDVIESWMRQITCLEADPSTFVHYRTPDSDSQRIVSLTQDSRLTDARAELAEACCRLTEAQEEISRLTDEIRALRSSTSWRITAPVRQILMRFR